MTVEPDSGINLTTVRDDPLARQQLQGGGPNDKYFAVMYVDSIPVGVHWSDERCLAATASLANDHYKMLGEPGNGEPDVLSNTMEITLPKDKVQKLVSLLHEGPPIRTAAALQEVWKLQGSLYSATFCIRPGRYFVWRLIALTHGANAWRQRGPGVAGSKRVTVGTEVHADLDMWRWSFLNETELRTPIVTHIKRKHAQTWPSDASFEAIGGYCLETGTFWRYDLTQEQASRVLKESHKNQPTMLLNINILELLGMVVSAYVMDIQLRIQPEFAGDLVLLRDDNKSAVDWINKAGGTKDPRAGALMRLFGVVEMSTSWCFKANYIKGIENTLVDTISRNSANDVLQRLTLLQPNIQWQQVTLSQQILNVITEALVSNWQPQHWGRELWSRMTVTGNSGVNSVIDVTETII
eukprot:5960-Heterococcus_DN1.PRE.3